MNYHFPDAKFSIEYLSKDLHERIEKNTTPKDIASWLYPIYIDYWRELTPQQDEIIATITHMEAGPEFEMSKEKLLDLVSQLSETG